MTANITITGNTGHDAKHFEDTGRTLFRVAQNTKFRNKEGELVERVTWFQVVVWGKGAKRLAELVGKGSRVVVSGRLRLQPMTQDARFGEVFYRAIIDTQAAGVEYLNLKEPAGAAEEMPAAEPTELDPMTAEDIDDEIPF